jgi:hypothetical protein
VAVKYGAFIINPIEAALGKAGPKVVGILGPAVPALLIGIPAHILASKTKNKYLLAVTKGLLAATIVGIGSSASRAMFGDNTVAGIPMLRGYDFTPGSKATHMGQPVSSADFGRLGQPVASADFGAQAEAQVTEADFGGMGRYITSGEAEAMGGYDQAGDFGAADEYEEGLGSLG